MKIEDILDLWEEDSKIDRTEIGNEATVIPQLHHKYYSIYVSERLVLRKQETDFKQLKLDKYEFLTQGPNEDTKDKGWKLPPKGMILKSDIPMYMDADEDVVAMSLRIGYQQEKLELLDSIIKTIMNRGYLLKTALDWQKFTMGA
jgi:hypothetical protein